MLRSTLSPAHTPSLRRCASCFSARFSPSVSPPRVSRARPMLTLADGETQTLSPSARAF
jgi:hypothetical protein